MNQNFSVLMSIYAGENPVWFDQALYSTLIEQTILPSQVVIVVDGLLSNELENIVLSYSERFPVIVDIFRLDHNKGLGHALWFGLTKCKFSLVARMDSDDICKKYRFEKQLSFLSDNPKCDIIGGFAEVIDENSNELMVLSVPLEDELIHKNIWACPLIHPTVMFKKDFILRVGSYNKLLRRRQDYDLWLRSSFYGAVFSNIECVLLQYRKVHGSNKQSSRLAFEQGLIGLKWVKKLSLSPAAYIGVFYPFIKSLFPVSVLNVLDKLMFYFDPRKQK